MGKVFFGGAFDALPDLADLASAVVDGRGVIVGWSPGAERLLGYPGEEAVAQPVEWLLAEDADALAGRLVPSHQGWSGAAVLRHRDGHGVEVLLCACPAFEVRGGVHALVVVLPGQRSAAQPVDLSAEEAFAQCHMPVVRYDDRLLAVQVSAGVARVLGLPEEQLVGRPITDVVPEPEGTQVQEAMRRVLRTGAAEEMQLHAEVPGVARERTWTVCLSPLKDRTGQVRQVQLFALDTTEEYRARERLALLNEVSSRVGSTLDVTRTAQEMADAAVGLLTDFVTVDLLDWIFTGEEPQQTPSPGEAPLRRAAQQSVLPGTPESVVTPGELDHYPPQSPPTRCLATGRATVHQSRDEEIVSWRADDPARSAVVDAFGMHSIMVVPLCARGVTLGVAVLVRHRNPKPFTRDDLLLAEEIAARAAVSVDNARRYTHERTTALALQRYLLPHQLTGQEAVEAASRYLPARSQAGIGGDWFDVIPLSGARVALVVGDVVGHGLRASATMGRLRTAVRTLADIDVSPDELLVHLDDLVTRIATRQDSDNRGTVTELVATCLYVVYDPISRHCIAASAGHPPPAVVTPDGTAAFFDLASGPPLGLGGLPFEVAECTLPEGSLLALYTDGLVQDRDRDMDQGLEQLLHHLKRRVDALEPACDALLEALLPQRPTDDVALLLARTRAFHSDQVATFELACEPAAVPSARAAVSRRLADWGLQSAAFTTELVASELVTNAIRYGGPPIQLRLIRDSHLICEVSDGSSTAPHLRRARIFDEGGRGLLLVAQFTEHWGSRHTPTGKTIWAQIAPPRSDEQQHHHVGTVAFG